VVRTIGYGKSGPVAGTFSPCSERNAAYSLRDRATQETPPFKIACPATLGSLQLPNPAPRRGRALAPGPAGVRSPRRGPARCSRRFPRSGRWLLPARSTWPLIGCVFCELPPKDAETLCAPLAEITPGYRRQGLSPESNRAAYPGDEFGNRDRAAEHGVRPTLVDTGPRRRRWSAARKPGTTPGTWLGPVASSRR
jgi:hypothetical protein